MLFARATRGDREHPLQARKVVWLVRTAESAHELETRGDLARQLYIASIGKEEHK